MVLQSEDSHCIYNYNNPLLSHLCTSLLSYLCYPCNNLLEFALDKFSISKEELEEEYKKSKIKEQELEDMKKRCNDSESCCSKYECCMCGQPGDTEDKYYVVKGYDYGDIDQIVCSIKCANELTNEYINRHLDRIVELKTQDY